MDYQRISDQGRRFTGHSSITWFQAPNGASIEIAAYSANRVRIEFRTDEFSDLLLSPTNKFTLGSSVILVNRNYGQVILDVRDVGTLVQNQWYAQGNGGAVFVTVIETVED